MKTAGHILVIGAGRLGRAWHAELKAAGKGAVVLWARRPPGDARFGGGPLTQAPVDGASAVLLCVQDDRIEAAAAQLAQCPGLKPDVPVFHCSGLKVSDAMAALKAPGNPLGSLHPLQSFPTAPVVGRMAGVVFAVEGDEAAIAFGLELAKQVGGLPRVITAAQKPFYHAAAVIASNLLVAVADAAVEAATLGGFEGDEALEMLLPLIGGSVKNLAELGLPGALTGPIARGDVKVVQAHLRALSGAGELSALYRILSKRAVDVARRQGAAGEQSLDDIKCLLDLGAECAKV